MAAYFDTGALVPLYVPEAFSRTVTAYVQKRGDAIPVNVFHLLELETAVAQKVFRGEINETRLQAVMERIALDLAGRRMRLCPVDWVQAIEGARGVGKMCSARFGCRTLDLIHVAAAIQWGSDAFVTADDRQVKAACVAGLKVVDIRSPRSLRP
ncbi:MAG: type II toxin-antitoxin system VapC family toxin [Acidobacteriota bacterium]